MDSPATSPSATAELARFAAGLRFEDLPPRVVRHAQRIVLDALGCGLRGSDMPAARRLWGTLSGLGRPGPATIWGSAASAEPLTAALVNGTAVAGPRSDDVHRNALLHAGAVIVPACLALAEARPTIDGRALLCGVVAGVEVGARVGLAAGYGAMQRGFEPASYTGTFCAAAAAGRLLGLDAPALRDALGVAGSLGSGLMGAQRGAMVLPLHAGRAGESGLLGALLAEGGFTGMRDVVEARYGGFVSALSAQPRWELLTRGLGTEWEIQGVGFKPYPCGASTHTAIEAAFALRDALSAFTPADLVAIVVATTTLTRDHGGWAFDPREGPDAARMNIPYCTAVALLSGRIQFDDFTDVAITRPSVQALAARIRVVVDPALDATGLEGRHAVAVQVRTADGRQWAARRAHARGSPSLPLGDEEVQGKFEDLAVPIVGAARARSLADAVWHLPRLPDAAVLARLLGRPSPPDERNSPRGYSEEV